MSGSESTVDTTLVLTERVYLAARIAVSLVLIALCSLGLMPYQGSVTPPLAFLIGSALLAGGGIFMLVARKAWRQPTATVLWELLPLDLTAAVLLVATTGSQEDPFFPWILGIVFVYAVECSRVGSRLVSITAAVLYFAAHLISLAPMLDIADIALFALNAAAIVFSGLVMVAVAESHREREMALAASKVGADDMSVQLSQRLAELRAISEIAEVIHSSLEFGRTGPLVLDILAKVLGLECAYLAVVDKESQRAVLSAQTSIGWLDAQLSDVERLVHGQAIPRSDDDPAAPSCMTLLDGKRLRVVLCSVGGWLDQVRAEDRLVAQAVASELASAVDNLQLFELTRQLSITDELTGLFNYRHLQQRMEQEVERARRYDGCLTLLMLDIDDFKGFNDAFGHLAGDRALAEIGALLRQDVREIDLACRYGGEEFSVLLPETDAAGAAVVAEKIRASVATHTFADGEGRRTAKLSVSIGAAAFPGIAADRETLLRQADAALYQAKLLGRDRAVVVSGDEGNADADDPTQTGA